jgi:GxxExxY protein
MRCLVFAPMPDGDPPVTRIAETAAGTERNAQTYAVIGAGTTCHRELGLAFLEPVYQEALAPGCRLRGIPFEREVSLPSRYRTMLLKTSDRADFISSESFLIERKALQRPSSLEGAQITNHLKASGPPNGLLLNSGGPGLEYKRLVLTPHKSA